MKKLRELWLDLGFLISYVIPMPFVSEYEERSELKRTTWWQWRDHVWRAREKRVAL